MNRDITAREQRLAPHAGSAEKSFTIEVKLVCPVDNRHHVGTLSTGLGSSWSLRNLQPSSISRYVKRAPEAARVTASAESIFDVMDGSEEFLSAAEHGEREQIVVATSVLRREQTPNGEWRIRWDCCHCQVSQRRGPRSDNILKESRLATLVDLMRNHGPSRLSVELSAVGIDDAAADVRRHADQIAPSTD